MWQAKGFTKEEHPDVIVAIEQLSELLISVRKKYEALSQDELLKYRAPGKWSKQQVLGHLVDSAVNNLERFTEVQFAELPYVIHGYSQNELVVVNNYQQLPIGHLLNLWQSLNQQIIYVVQAIPAGKLLYEVVPQYGKTGSKTLAWLICDYVAHIRHHLDSEQW